MTFPGRQVRQPPRNILKFIRSTIFLVNLAQFPLEGEENPYCAGVLYFLLKSERDLSLPGKK